MLHVAAAAIVNNNLPWILRVLATDLREEGGERVIVIHGPPVEWMIVALGTLNAHAHEDLGGILRDLEGVPLNLVVIGGRTLEGATG